MTVDVWGPATFGVLNVTAHGTLSGHRVVMPRPEDNTVEYADASNLRYLSGPLWLTMHSAVDGEDVEVVTYGQATEPTWSWTPGVALWLATAGAMTQVVPVATTALFARMVAVALTPTTLFFDLQVPILLTP